jgi:ABC-type transporter Mla subunit MlaD
MPAIKTDGDRSFTESFPELAARLDHLDDMLHRIDQRTAAVSEFIEEHKPALARGLALVDPGAKLRKMMGGKRDHAAT